MIHLLDFVEWAVYTLDENMDKNQDKKPITGEITETFGLKRANEWLEQAKAKPLPRALIGGFWSEGELAIMFADTGKGKSILAVQVAEAVARGEAVEPLKADAKPQNVLYLDCELTEKQFEMRYAEDPEADQPTLKNHYQFSDNFFRAQVDLSGDVPDGYKTTQEYLYDAIAKLTEQANAKVVIVDNISILQRSNDHAGSALVLMQSLRKLKNEMGLSILVLAHTPKRSASKPLSINDLTGFKTLSNFADSVFAIGQSRMESDIRYIKHLKQRSAEMLCDERNVPSFRIAKRGGNFLSFEFLRYTTEAVHLFNYQDKMAFQRVALVKKLSTAGMTQRTISQETGISLGAVNKYLHMEFLDQATVETAIAFDIGARLAIFPGCEKVDRQIAAKKMEHRKESNSFIRDDIECDIEELGLQRDLEQRKYWVASGKITGDAVEGALRIRPPQRKRSPDLFIETPLPGQPGYRKPAR